MDVVLSWGWVILLAGGGCRAPGKALCLHTSPRAGCCQPGMGARGQPRHQIPTEGLEKGGKGPRSSSRRGVLHIPGGYRAVPCKVLQRQALISSSPQLHHGQKSTGNASTSTAPQQPTPGALGKGKAKPCCPLLPWAEPPQLTPMLLSKPSLCKARSPPRETPTHLLSSLPKQPLLPPQLLPSPLQTPSTWARAPSPQSFVLGSPPAPWAWAGVPETTEQPREGEKTAEVGFAVRS